MMPALTSRSAQRFVRLSAGVATAALIGVGTAFAADPELTLFEWAGYEDPEFHKSYLEKHGDSPSFAFFGDEEEAFQKLMAGFKADISHPCSQSVVKWREAGLLEPWDVSRIEAYDDLMPGLKDQDGFVVDGEVYVIPYDWGNTFMVYRTDMVEEGDITSLRAFADPKFAGKVSIGDNVADAYALASLALGITNWTTMTDEQFQQASDFLRDVHKNVRFYWSDGGELQQAFANGEITLAWAWNETPTTAKANGLPVDFNRDTEEGLSTWVCGFVKLANGEGNEDKLYDYINAQLEPQTAEYLVTAWGYGHANQAALDAMDEATLAEYGYDNLGAFVDKTLFQSPVPADLQERMNKEFERIKAGF